MSAWSGKGEETGIWQMGILERSGTARRMGMGMGIERVAVAAGGRWRRYGAIKSSLAKSVKTRVVSTPETPETVVKTVLSKSTHLPPRVFLFFHLFVCIIVLTRLSTFSPLVSNICSHGIAFNPLVCLARFHLTCVK